MYGESRNFYEIGIASGAIFITSVYLIVSYTYLLVYLRYKIQFKSSKSCKETRVYYFLLAPKFEWQLNKSLSHYKITKRTKLIKKSYRDICNNIMHSSNMSHFSSYQGDIKYIFEFNRNATIDTFCSIFESIFFIKFSKKYLDILEKYSKNFKEMVVSLKKLFNLYRIIVINIYL